MFFYKDEKFCATEFFYKPARFPFFVFPMINAASTGKNCCCICWKIILAVSALQGIPFPFHCGSDTIKPTLLGLSWIERACVHLQLIRLCYIETLVKSLYQSSIILNVANCRTKLPIIFGSLCLITDLVNSTSYNCSLIKSKRFNILILIALCVFSQMKYLVTTCRLWSILLDWVKSHSFPAHFSIREPLSSLWTSMFFYTGGMLSKFSCWFFGFSISYWT